MAELSDDDAHALRILAEYLQIPSVHPDVDYGPCEEWVRKQAETLRLPLQVVRPKNEKKPVLIVTWPGTEPELPSIMLNSHMDVVPVFKEHWTHEPFAATRTADGNIYGRGAQDMKSVAVLYLEAVRRLRAQCFQPRRTVHITFVPDEEIGSEDGMEAFVKTDVFAEMNVGFSLDEGACSPGEDFIAFYTERSDWKMEFLFTGTSGHGSMLLDDIAADKLRVVLDHLQDFRAGEKAKITSPLSTGLVTAINVTIIQGGVQRNVVPSEIRMVVDARLAPDVNHDDFLKMLEGWCREAGAGTELRFLAKGPVEGTTAVNESNIWWKTLENVFHTLGLNVIPAVCPGGTDARFLRRLGIPAFGVTVLNHTPILLHAHDEFVNDKIFLQGVNISKEIIKQLTLL